MVEYKVIQQEEVKKDLREILYYIAVRLASPENANHVLDRLEKAIEGLSVFPERHRRFSEEPWFSMNIRECVVKNYSIFYRTDRDKKEVVVFCIIYNRRNINEQLKRIIKG